MDAEQIFHEAVEITDPEKRAAYLDGACRGDEELRARVEALLKADERAGSFLEVPPVQAGATLNNPAKIDGPGTVIGRYELLELIGEGGMGLVYLAEQKEPVKRRVALKIIKPGMDSRQVVARFEAERQALALLDHPNIAHVFDAGCTETGRPYFVMEHVKGMSITRYCDDNKLTIEQRLRLFEQVCEAVHHAHQKGIIHRDLKPSNILVSVHGDRAVPKIIDFGIAKAITSPLTDKTFFTFQGQLLGTPEYMSPEQVDLATQDIDTRSDIYSLGVVLYELLAGVLPFESDAFARAGLAEIQQTIREQEPASPSIRLTGLLGEQAKTIAARRGTQVVPLARRLHRELEWIPLKAMRKDRCRRYKSAAEMADDVRRYLDGNPLLAGPETTIYRVQKFVRKHVGSVATAAVVAVAIVLGLVVSTGMYFRSERALQRETVARAEAEDARTKENIARTRAEQAEQTTKSKADELRRTLYVNSIQLADAKHLEGNARRVRDLLDSCPEDLRGWEWNYLNHIADQSILTLRGHEDSVDSFAVSPTGQCIASAGKDRTIRIWNLATGETTMVLKGHEGPVLFVAFDPSGEHIVSSADDGTGTVRLRNAAHGKELMTMRGHQGAVYAGGFTVGGKRVISCSEDKTVKVWDVADGGEIMTLHGEDEVISIAVSPDSKWIAAGGVDRTLRIWNAVDGHEAMVLRGHEGAVACVAFSPDGRQIASGSWDRTIKVWDVNTGVERMTLHGHSYRVNSLAFSPDGKRIVSGGRDNAIRVWDSLTGAELLTLRGHEASVSCVAFSPNGEQVISSSTDKTIKVWDVAIGKEFLVLRGRPYPFSSASFSPEGKLLISGNWDGTIKVWDTSNGAEVRTVRGHEGGVFSLAVSPDDRRIASGGSDKTIRIWDVATGTEMTTMSGHEGWVRSLAFSPDGSHLVSGAEDKTIRLWDAAKGSEEMTLTGHEAPVCSVAFSPDGRHIASGSADRTIRLWSVETGAETMALRGHDAPCSVSYSPDGRHLLSCSWDGTIKVWDAGAGEELISRKVNCGHAVFTPDGKRIIAGNMILDATTGTDLMALRGNPESLMSIAVSHDGRTIAAAGIGSVVLWESCPPRGGYLPRKIANAGRIVVDELYQKHGFYAEVISILQAQTTITESIRTVALQIANSRLGEDAEKLEGELRKLANSRTNLEAHKAMLDRAEMVNRLDPNDRFTLNVLGFAQYRVGAYEDALKTLSHVDQIRTKARLEHNPVNLAFKAMTLHQLGRADEAKSTLQQLRGLLKDERFADDAEATALLAEAQGLIEGKRP